jgi:hypothetical protein
VEQRKICPQCKYVVSVETKFCTNCGYQFVENIFYQPPMPQAAPQIYPTPKSSQHGLLTAAGILIIIGSAIAGYSIYSDVTGIFTLSSWGLTQYALNYYLGINSIFLVCAALGFSLGLTAGILVLRKKKFALSLVGASVLLVTRVLQIVFSLYFTGVILYEVVIVSVPLMVLAVIGLVFLTVRKKEFS